MVEPQLSIELNVNFQPFNELKAKRTIPLAPSPPVESESELAQQQYSPSDTVVSPVVPFAPDIQVYD